MNFEIDEFEKRQTKKTGRGAEKSFLSSKFGNYNKGVF